MLKDFLFEIECAEKLGNYKLADAMDKKLYKLATSDKRAIQKQIIKKFNGAIKDISYSPSQNKFIIAVESSLSNNTKRDIKTLADPFNVSFRYSQHQNFKDIDALMGVDADFDPYMTGGKAVSPEERHLKKFDDLGPEYIGLDALDDMEPTDEDLRFEEEFPADKLSSDPNSMDPYWVDHARRDINKLLQ